MEINFKPNKMYSIDMEKVQTIEDLKCIFEALDVQFGENYEHFDTVKHLLKETQK